MREAIERNQEMAQAYRSEDITLGALGCRYGISRQRIKQIFGGMGVTYEQSGRCARLLAQIRRPSIRTYRRLIPDGITDEQYWRRQALEALGGRCAVCGFDDIRALEIDHINGDGTKHRARRGHGGGVRTFYRSIAKGVMIETVQVLCANHHSIKTFEERKEK